VRHEFRVWVLAFITGGLMTGCALPPDNTRSESQQEASSKASSAEALSDAALCACDSPIATDHFDAALQQLGAGDYEAARESLTQHGASGLDQASQESNAGLDLIDAIIAQDLQPNSDETDLVSARGSALRLLLALIADLQNQIAEAQADNAQMKVELEKRDEALKRLRELTLGQPES